MGINVKKEEAVELFEALGITTAAKWNGKRMALKLGKVDEMVDEDTKLEGAADKTLTKVLKAIENEEEIVVVDGGDQPAPKAPAASKKAASKKTGGKKAEPKAPAEPESDAAFAELKAQYDAGEITAKEFAAKRKALVKAEPKAPAASKKAASKKTGGKKAEPKKAAEPKPEKDGPTAVREGAFTRPGIAGQVIKEYGLEAGVTEEMVNEVDERFGNVNPRQSIFYLRIAWHAINGYMGK